jgi:hypothetical protein
MIIIILLLLLSSLLLLLLSLFDHAHPVTVTDALHPRTHGGSSRSPTATDYSYYGTWTAQCRVYLAVGLVWVFWFIAVIPMLMCGFLRQARHSCGR